MCDLKLYLLKDMLDFIVASQKRYDMVWYLVFTESAEQNEKCLE